MSLEQVDRQTFIGGIEADQPAGQLASIARQVRQFLSRYGVLLGFLAAWQVSSSNGWINPAVFPPIDAIVAALWRGIVGGALLEDIAISLQRSGVAYVGAVLFSIPLGLFMGQIPAVERALDPILQFFRQTSALALYPVFILMLGLGEASKTFVIFWATLFPLLLNTIGGVKEVDPKLIEMARVYNATRLTIFRRVVLPGAIPSIFVGLRLSATTALLLLDRVRNDRRQQGCRLPGHECAVQLSSAADVRRHSHPGGPGIVRQLLAGLSAAAFVPLD